MPIMSASDFVTLTGGLTVPLPVLQALWSLEDRAAVRRWRNHVVAVLQYCEQERVQ